MNGDDGSKRLKVDASVGQFVPDALTLSTALRRGQYTSGEARMLQKSLSQILDQRQEVEDGEATAAFFREQQEMQMASL